MLIIKKILKLYLSITALFIAPVSAFASEPFFWIVEPQFDDAGCFSEGMAPVMSGGKYGYIGAGGNLVIVPAYDMAGDFHDGAAVVFTGEVKGVINRKGIPVIAHKEDAAVYTGEGLAVIRINNRYGYIRTDSVIALPPLYEGALYFSEGCAPVKINGKYGFINKKGKVIIKPLYDRASVFSQGLAAVMINGNWGYINKRGRIVLKTIYGEAGDFSEGFAHVKKDSLYGYINKNGRFIVMPRFEEALPFSEKKAAVKVDGRWGYIKLSPGKSGGKGKKISEKKVRDNALTPERVSLKKTGEKTGRESGLKAAGKIEDKKLSEKELVNITEKGVKEADRENNSRSESVTRENDYSTAGKEREYTPVFDYESGKELAADSDIPDIKGMQYAGIVSEVNEGQVVINDHATGKKIYLGAWCITRVEGDRVYLDAGTPFSTVARCDFNNGYYEKIKPGMKVYKKIK